MNKVKKQAIDLIEDMFFCLVQEFKLPIQSFDRNEINQSISKLKKVAEESGLNHVVSQEFHNEIKDALFSHHPPINDSKKSQKFSSLYSQILNLSFFINKLSDEDSSNLDQLYNEYLHQLNIELYLGFKSKYIGTTHIESIDLKFSSEITKYKTYLRRKKDSLFFEILEKTFKERDEKWSSTYDVITSEQTNIELEFQKFDIEWLKSEISYKENFIQIIPQIYSKGEIAYKADPNRSNTLITYTHFTPDLKEIKNQTKIVKDEIFLLNKLMSLLLDNSADKKFIEKYIPYNSDSLTDTLTKLLTSNKILTRKIIRSNKTKTNMKSSE